MLPRLFAQPPDCLRAKQDRRGRSALLWGLAGILMLQAAFYPLNRLWPQLQDGEYGGKLSALRTLMAAKPKDAPSVVMVGGSLTSCDFNPSALTTVRPGKGGPVAYNFGINNGRAVVQLLCVRRLLADGIRPDLLLVDTYPWCFFPGCNGFDNELYFSTVRLQRADLSVFRRYHPDAARVCRDWEWLCCTPWYSYRHNLQRYMFPDWLLPYERQLMWWDIMDKNGWEYVPGHVAAMRTLPRDRIVASVMYHVEAMNCQPIDEKIYGGVYRDMAEACRRAKVPLVFVRMPESSPLREKLLPAVKDRLDSAYDALRRDAGVPVVDARAWVPDDDGFIDDVHLNPQGAALFTQRLEREVLVPGVFRLRQGRASSR